MWYCAAHKNSITVYPDGIAPCCLIDSSYRKSIDNITNRDIFSDLQTGTPPEECKTCVDAENAQLTSYRQFYNRNARNNNDLQFIDIRNSNLCNLKCRTCNPEASSQWGKELGMVIPIVQQPIKEHLENLTAPTVHTAYFTGGEPFINPDHWATLEKFISSGQSANVSLLYNTNLTTLKYKDIDITEMWKNFRSVEVICSIDAVYKKFEYIRSGASWADIENNFQQLIKLPLSNLKIRISPTVSILSFWGLPALYEYFKDYKIDLNLLNGPDFLNLNAMPDELKEQAFACLQKIQPYLDRNVFNAMEQRIHNNYNQSLITHTIAHVLLLDKIRNENLFDLLPFKEFSKKMLLDV